MTPKRTPVPVASTDEDLELIERLKRKTSYLPPPEEVDLSTPTSARGLAEIFQTIDEPFAITEEEVEIITTEGAFALEDPVWSDITAQLINASCAFFAQEILSGPPEVPYNGHFLISEHHEEWDELIVDYDRICVLAHRDSGKTFFFDYAYPLWKAVTQPNGIGFIFSATQPQAERILDDIKNELETNPNLRWLVPSSKEKWSGTYRWHSTHIRLANGHRIFARGFGTKVRGAHPHWIVVDDGLNDETAYSETVRNKQNDYFYTAITNMIVPGGQIIVVGTPFHQDDLYGDLSKNSEYEFRKYPAIKSDGTALWPDRYDLERLAARKREIGSIRFTREFMVEAVNDDMSLFPSHLFKGDPTEQMSVKLGMPKEYWDTMGISAFMGVDFALSSSVEADYTVVWVMGTDRFGNRWIMDIKREKGMPYQGQLSLINSTAQKYKPGLIFLEANQAQRIFGDELIRKTDLPIKQFTTGAEKHSLEKGVPSLRVLLENQKFRIPRGDKESVELTDIWINEMRSFTWQEGKLQSVGGHDDCVMAAWITDQAIRQGGFSYSFGDEEDEANARSYEELMEELTGDTVDENIQGPDSQDKESGKVHTEKSGNTGASGNLVDDSLHRAPLPSELGIHWEW